MALLEQYLIEERAEIVEQNMVGLPVYDQTGVTRVVAVKHNGVKPVYRVRLANGNSVEATAVSRP